MPKTLEVEQLDSPPAGGTIHHYDELEEEFKHLLPNLIDQSTAEEALWTESTVGHGDCVKFTEYYRVLVR